MRASGSTNGAGLAAQDWLDVLRKFLFVGLGVKRWLLLGAAGIGMLSLGFAFLFKNILALTTPDVLPWLWEGVVVGALGVAAILVAVYGLYRTLRPILFASGSINGLADALYTRRSRGRGPRVVAIGGGTGLSVLLRGLKTHSDNISAVVTVADDGGSSGRLRRELGVLPPGDFRNCLVAMAGDEVSGGQAVPAPVRPGRRARGPQLRQSVHNRDDRRHGQLRGGALRVEQSVGRPRPHPAVHR